MIGAEAAFLGSILQSNPANSGGQVENANPVRYRLACRERIFAVGPNQRIAVPHPHLEGLYETMILDDLGAVVDVRREWKEIPNADDEWPTS